MSNAHKNTIRDLEAQIKKNNSRSRRNMRKNRELLEAVHKLKEQMAALTPSTDSEPETIRPVRLHMLLDRSGSMSGLAGDVIGGFNAFVDKQRDLEGECYLNLVQFDSEDPFQIIYENVELDQVQRLTSEMYYPRAATPLYDALGSLITKGGSYKTRPPQIMSCGYSLTVLRMPVPNTVRQRLKNLSNRRKKRDGSSHSWVVTLTPMRQAKH